MSTFSGDQSLNIVVRLKDEASAALKGIEGQISKFQSKIEPAADASRKFALALGGAGAAVGAFGLTALKSAANMEQTQIAFETMLGSAEKAKKFYGDLVNFAAKTPFELKGLETASKQLLAYGFEQEQVLPNLKALGDIASGVGMDKLPNLILAFGQVKAATRLTGMELRQFTEAGVPMLDELSKIMKKPVAAIQEMVSAGEIGFPIVQQALMNLTGEGGRFNNLMDKQAKSLGGMWSNLNDAWEQFLRGAGAQLIDWAKKFVAALIIIVQEQLPKWIEKTKEVIKWLGENKVVLYALAGAIAGALTPAVLAAVASFALLAIELAPFAIAGGALFMLIKGVKDGNVWITALAAGILTMFIPALASLAVTIWTTVIPAVAAMAVAFWPFLVAGVIVAGVVAGVMLIIKHWDLIKEKTGEVWNAIKTFVTENLNTILLFLGPAGWLIMAIKGIIEHWDLIKAKTQEVWDFIVNFLKTAIALIVGLVATFLDWLVPGWDEALIRMWHLWQESWNSFKTLAGEVITAISEAVGGFFDQLAGVVSTGMSAVKEIWVTVWSAISSFFVGLWEPVRQAIKGVVDFIVEQIQKAIDMYNKLKDMLNKPIQAVGNAASSAGNAVGNFFNDAMNRGKGLLGFEHGGIIAAPRGQEVPIIAHGQERIIPAGQAVGGGGGFTVVIQNPQFRTEDDEARLKRMLDTYFRPLLINHKIK